MPVHLDRSPRPAARCSTGRRPGYRRVAGRLAAGLARLGAWIGRAAERARQRRMLERLDDRLLRDIGLSRREARTEAVRPFWQP